jgi:hypothetical protein
VQAQSDPIPHSKDEPTWDDPTGHARFFLATSRRLRAVRHAARG